MMARTPPQRQLPPFRRRRFVAPHRRPGLLRQLARPFVAALITVGLPATVAAWALTTPVFALRHLEIEETHRVPAEWVGEVLAPLQGRHLLLLSLSDVDRRLRGHPWIEGAAVRRELPDRLVVRILERAPAALLRRGDGIWYVDRRGRVIDAYDLAGPVDLVLLSTSEGVPLDVGAALEVAAALTRAREEWGQALSEIEALTDRDFRLYTAALPFPLVVSAGRVEQGVDSLREFLPEILRRYDRVAAVDVRFSRQIVVQPAGDPPNQKG